MKTKEIIEVLRRISSFIALVFLFTACSDNRIFDEVVKIPSEKWHADDVYTFKVNVSDTTKVYDIYFHIRNTSDYDFSNIWLFIDTQSPNGAEMRDTVEFVLADASGAWYGSGLGDVYSLLLPYKQNIHFPYRGIYSFTFNQAMRTDVLYGIKDVGLRVQER